MPLKVIVVGAGIAGLCAAIALRQAGHEVEIFEKSAFATEIGAAIMITPNGTRVLDNLGFSFSRARAVTLDSISILDGETLEQKAGMDVSQAERTYGAKLWAVHRVDLHRELLRLAMDPASAGHPVSLRLSAEVASARPDGTVLLRDGKEYAADLVVAADGLKSRLKGVVTGEAGAPSATGLSAFRFLLETEELRKDGRLEGVLERRGAGGVGSLQDLRDPGTVRFMIWYGCRGGDIQNFVGIHPTKDVDSNDQEAVKQAMLEEFGHYAPEILDIIRQSSSAKCWPLFVHPPLSNWYNGRVVLIGDAAHPMLPFNSQGATSAMEDGGALGYLFENLSSPAQVPGRLAVFQQTRAARVARVQLLSSAKLGCEKSVEEQVRRWADPPGSRVPTNMVEHVNHDYGYNVFAKCDEALAVATNQSMPA